VVTGEAMKKLLLLFLLVGTAHAQFETNVKQRVFGSAVTPLVVTGVQVALPTLTPTPTYTATPTGTVKTGSETPTPSYTLTPTYTPVPYPMSDLYYVDIDALSTGVTLYFPHIATYIGYQLDIPVTQSSPTTILQWPQIGWDCTNASVSFVTSVGLNKTSGIGTITSPCNALVLIPKVTPTTTQTIKIKIALCKSSS
jgi:hypothetical protein